MPRPFALIPLTLLLALASTGCDEAEAGPAPVKDTFVLSPKITVRGDKLWVEVPDVEKAEITVQGQTVTAVSEPGGGGGNKWLAKTSITLPADLKPGPQTLEVEVKDHFGHVAKVPVEFDHRPRPMIVWGTEKDRAPGWTYEGDAIQYRVFAPDDHLPNGPVIAALDDEGNLVTTISGPAGTKLGIGGHSFTIDKDKVEVKLPLLDQLGALDAAKLVDTTTTTTIELPITYDGNESTDKFEVSTHKLAADWFRRAMTRPALFSGETATPGGRKSLLFFPGGSLQGTAATARDVDLAVFWTTTEKKLPVCKYDGNYEFHRTVATGHGVVVDRRAGKVIARKTFTTKESTKCPRSIADTAGSSGSSQRFGVDVSDTSAWVSSHLAK